MNIEEELSKADNAKQILESDIFKEMRENVRGGIISQIERCPIADEKMQSKLVMTLQLWGVLEKYFDTVIDTGKLAEFQLAQEEKKRNWFQRAA